MAVAQEREGKVERLEVRLTPTTKSLLTYAAQLTHTTLTDFLVSSAVRAAEDVLVSPRLFEINTEEGWSTLMDILDELKTAEPSPKLAALFRTDSQLE